ncbi:hypothetical protein GCM10010413_37890 [Promicromonospora sukumoe]
MSRSGRLRFGIASALWATVSPTLMTCGNESAAQPLEDPDGRANVSEGTDAPGAGIQVRFQVVLATRQEKPMKVVGQGGTGSAALGWDHSVPLIAGVRSPVSDGVERRSEG